MLMSAERNGVSRAAGAMVVVVCVCVCFVVLNDGKGSNRECRRCWYQWAVDADGVGATVKE